MKRIQHILSYTLLGGMTLAIAPFAAALTIEYDAEMQAKLEECRTKHASDFELAKDCMDDVMESFGIQETKLPVPKVLPKPRAQMHAEMEACKTAHIDDEVAARACMQAAVKAHALDEKPKNTFGMRIRDAVKSRMEARREQREERREERKEDRGLFTSDNLRAELETCLSASTDDASLHTCVFGSARMK